MALDMVWAEIALAAIAGSAFYGMIALIERGATFGIRRTAHKGIAGGV